jgi:hypothetical protein
MEAFTQTVEGWHDFYLMIGTAAATLVGLLFVSLSLNVDVITREENGGSAQTPTKNACKHDCTSPSSSVRPMIPAEQTSIPVKFSARTPVTSGQRCGGGAKGRLRFYAGTNRCGHRGYVCHHPATCYSSSLRRTIFPPDFSLAMSAIKRSRAGRIDVL